MGRRKRDQVRKWVLEHPAPKLLPEVPTADDLEPTGEFRRSVPYDVDELKAAALEVIKAAERAQKDGDPGDRPCFACGHLVRDHMPGASCPCCLKGVLVVPPGTDLMAAAIARGAP